jgi:hypothetical protein
MIEKISNRENNHANKRFIHYYRLNKRNISKNRKNLGNFKHDYKALFKKIGLRSKIVEKDD